MLNNKLIGRYCGRQMPSSFISMGNEFNILYQTRGNTNKFSLKYETGIDEITKVLPRK